MTANETTWPSRVWPLWCGMFVGGLLTWIASSALAPAQTQESVQRKEEGRAGRCQVLILVGIPGDEEHHRQFRATVDVWQRWFHEVLQVPAEQILIRSLADPQAAETLPALTRDGLTEVCRQLASQATADDQLWVLTLGHGMARPKWAAFHVSGLDITDEVLARELSVIPCRQQVVWLTHAGSGHWVRQMARPGRLVIAATSDDENNETEFPHALATVFSQYFPPTATVPKADPASSEAAAQTNANEVANDAANDAANEVASAVANEAASEASVNGEGDEAARSAPEKALVAPSLPANLAELFEATQREVAKRYASDRRVATEHAQLDDNGDGRGTEQLGSGRTDDGELARQWLIPVGPRASPPLN